jgi:SPP1 gp7 family putative phage head morphogenesis protein
MMEVEKRVIDYIMEQADRYDGENLKIESDIMGKISYLHDNMKQRIMSTVDVHGDISTPLQYQNLINRIQMVVDQFYSDAYKLLIPVIDSHVQKGYEDFSDLIDIGKEMEAKYKDNIGEIKRSMNDPNAIEFMKDHALEQVKGISNGILSNMKSKLGELLVQGRATRNNIKDELSDILKISRSRADMIVQTEVSMAYNQGSLGRMDEFNRISRQKVLKYWYGFKFSEVTCPYCRPRIGGIYDVNDNSEHLPAHPRCRCIWIPYMEGWDKPIPMSMTRGNLLNRIVYTPEDIYKRINKRLGINYGQYIDLESAKRYISGSRTGDTMKSISNARTTAISIIKNTFDIASEDNTQRMGAEFNAQMKFWKDYVSKAIVDNDVDILTKSHDAIKGMMLLPWSSGQLNKWNKLLNKVLNHI